MSRNNPPAAPPPALAAAAAPTQAGVPEQPVLPLGQNGAGNVNPADVDDQLDVKGTAEFTWKVHGYINEYIRFADAKAGVVMTWCAALIGVLFSAKVHHYVLIWPSWNWAWKETLLGTGSFLAFFTLVGGVVYGVGVITPRLRPLPNQRKSWKEWRKALPASIITWWRQKPVPPGFIFWDQILTYGTQSSYWENLTVQEALQLARAVADHNFTLAQITSEKYRCVKKSIQFGTCGTAVAAVVLLLTV